jgi:putative ABC transport system ATP-binding protein
MKKIIAEVKQASKTYKSGDGEMTALYPTDLQVLENELTLIIGPSGSGKTTLLSLLGCVIYPTTGEVIVDSVNITKLSPNKLSALRLAKIGFVFQSMNLIAPLTALQNVILPLELQGIAGNDAKKRALDALTKVSMTDRKDFLPKQLSGGQQQRIAIARALVTNPPLMLCDEPTAALDATSLVTVMKELRSLANGGRSVVVVTHDPRLKPYADRIVTVENGKISKIEENVANQEIAIEEH